MNTSIMQCYSCGTDMEPKDVISFEPEFEGEEENELTKACYAFHCPICGSYTEHHGGVDYGTND